MMVYIYIYIRVYIYIRIYIYIYTYVYIYIYYHFIYLFGGCYTGVSENGLIGIHRIARFLSEKMIIQRMWM